MYPIWQQCFDLSAPALCHPVERMFKQGWGKHTHTERHTLCWEKKWQQCGTLGKRPLVMLQVDRLPLSYPKSEGGKLEKNVPVLRSGHKDSCLSHSAKGLNVKCKHNHRFQKTVIASLFFRNVDHSSSQTETRKMIFSTVLTDYTHATLKCPGSCCNHSLCCFTFLTQEKELKVCLHHNYCCALIENCAIMISKWWQLTNVTRQQLEFWDTDWAEKNPKNCILANVNKSTIC